MTDNAFLYHVLEDGKWHGQSEIIAKSMRERGHGLTVHSRAADLRKKGCVVECELRRNGHGRAISYYRLVTLEEPVALIEAPQPRLTGSSSVPAATDGADQGSQAALSLVEPQAGTLELFTCVIDESAGLRGAYSEDAA